MNGSMHQSFALRLSVYVTMMKRHSLTTLLLFTIVISGLASCAAFVPASGITRRRGTSHRTTTTNLAAQVSQKEAQGGIDKVVAALRKDRSAKSELGNLSKVNNVLGFGSPKPNELAVRFNASFQKGGMGRMAKALPFGLGQTNESEGRGTMVGQVKASVDMKTGKITSCSVFRDLGYGRAWNMKC